MPDNECGNIGKQLGSGCDAESLGVSSGFKLFKTRPTVLPNVEGML